MSEDFLTEESSKMLAEVDVWVRATTWPKDEDGPPDGILYPPDNFLKMLH